MAFYALKIDFIIKGNFVGTRQSFQLARWMDLIMSVCLYVCLYVAHFQECCVYMCAAAHVCVCGFPDS